MSVYGQVHVPIWTYEPVVIGCVGWVAVCNLVSESVCEVVADRVVAFFDFA
jgi:hypothetical protein